VQAQLGLSGRAHLQLRPLPRAMQRLG
jgi:hypothetical protein